MKELFRKFSVTPTFLLFIFLFAYLSSIKTRIQAGHPVDWYLFTPESALVSIPELILVVALLGGAFFQSSHLTKEPIKPMRASFLFLMALCGFVLIMNLMSLLISLAFGTIDRNFSQNQITGRNLEYLVDFCIFGGFYLAYFLYQQDKKHRKKIEEFNQALAAAQIHQLRQQLDPHFLFNNLNILDQLILEDPRKASAFLLDFSDLFRYLLENGQNQLVSVQDELDFAKKYFNLIKHKYGEAYQLEINLPPLIAGEIPALSLQLLLENAVQHNFGTEKEPIQISISLENGLRVRNTRKAKSYSKKTGGRSLLNLKMQFEMLGKETPEIRQSSDTFEITLPVLNLSEV